MHQRARLLWFFFACLPALVPAIGQGAGIDTIPGMPAVLDPNNLYGAAGANMLSPAVTGDLPRVYVPDVRADTVTVIDPSSRKILRRFRVGQVPQHIVPSWDLKTLWVTNNGRKGEEGSLTPIDPKDGKPGAVIHVPDPYNMYFTPDGKSAIVVDERLKRLEFRDPHSFELQYVVRTPGCPGIDHGDFSIDGRYAIFTCEYGKGGLVKIDTLGRKVLGYLRLPRRSALQDIRVSPDGVLFYVADLIRGGVWVVAGDAFKVVGFIHTGIGAHGLYPSRDGKELYVANRGAPRYPPGPPHGKGSVAVIDFATRRVIKVWPIPGGGSPDMGNVSADGNHLWLSGRFDNCVYDIDTRTGTVTTIPLGPERHGLSWRHEPHGLAVWPQPGRYSLGHTGNMR